jgi:uncharacterized protein YbjT (DUF2867 family)
MTILVTGATGNVGRPLTELLALDGAEVRAVTRNPQAAGLPAGVEVITTVSSLRGVTSLFLNPRAVGKAAGELLALAREQGVRRVVTLSAINVEDDPADQPSRYRGDFNKEVEDVVTGSGLEWVSLRSSIFGTNTIGLWAAQIRASDVVRGPYAAAASAPIHERDLARVGAHALLTDELVGQRLLLTGPQSLNQVEMVAIIGEALGRSLHYQEIPPEAAKQGLVQRGFPAGFADAYLAMQAKSVGQPALTTNEVEKILDRPALSFAQWVADHKEAFQR